MKNWENWTEEERRERDKKIRKKRIVEVVNFILGLITLGIIACGTNYIGERLFGGYEGIFIVSTIFLIVIWNSKVIENERKEYDDKIKDYKQEVLDELYKLESQIHEMSENGEIDIYTAKKLIISTDKVFGKVIEINCTPSSLFFK